jgi:hypothetical protein
MTHWRPSAYWKPDPATRSLTVLETRTSFDAAVLKTPSAIWTAAPTSSPATNSHSPVCRPARNWVSRWLSDAMRAFPHVLLKHPNVRPDVCLGVKSDRVSTSWEYLLTDGLVDAVKGAAQTGAGAALVALRPQECRQFIAAVLSLRDRQIGEQGHRFAQAEFDRFSPALKTGRSK